MPWLITRADLYDLVWSEPLIAVAARFGVSDVAIGKACKRNSIPTPGVGFWRKAACGSRPRRTPLPRAPFGYRDPIPIGGDGWRAVDAELWQPTRRKPKPTQAEISERALSRVSDVPVPWEMKSCHQALAWLLDDERSRPITPLDRRRLRIVNAVVLAAEKAGAAIRWPRNREWFPMTIGEVEVGFRVDRVDRFERRKKLPPSHLDPLKLSIEATGDAWMDAGENLIEYHLEEIVRALIVSANPADPPR